MSEANNAAPYNQGKMSGRSENEMENKEDQNLNQEQLAATVDRRWRKAISYLSYVPQELAMFTKILVDNNGNEPTVEQLSELRLAVGLEPSLFPTPRVPLEWVTSDEIKLVESEKSRIRAQYRSDHQAAPAEAEAPSESNLQTIGNQAETNRLAQNSTAKTMFGYMPSLTEMETYVQGFATHDSPMADPAAVPSALPAVFAKYKTLHHVMDFYEDEKSAAAFEEYENQFSKQELAELRMRHQAFRYGFDPLEEDIRGLARKVSDKLKETFAHFDPNVPEKPQPHVLARMRRERELEEERELQDGEGEDL